MKHWWVFIQDTNGSRRFVGSPYKFASKEEADARVGEIEAQHNKPHKVDYWVVEHEGNAASVRECYNIQG